MKKIVLIIPVFNEEASIENDLKSIINEILQFQDVEFSVLVVDDGSRDATVDIIEKTSRDNIYFQLLCLTRNFGKEAAVKAGLCHAKGDAVIVMDSDLQHPPTLIPEMVRLWRKGIDVVEATKISRGKESILSKIFANGFYVIFKFFTNMNLKNHSDFKLLDRKVVDALCELRENQLFFRGLTPWLGFTTTQLPFNVPDRKIGSSSWTRYKLLKTSLVALTSFSSKPLQIISFLGAVTFGISLVFGGIALFHKVSGNAMSGFTTVILLLLIIGSFLMFGMGILGVYIGHIYNEVKRRPVYIIDNSKSTVGHLNKEEKINE